MKTIPMTLISAIAATLLGSAAFAADSGERTTMPSSCSDRDANCVIQDGPARRRGGGDSSTTTTPPRSTSGSDSNSSSSKSGNTKSGDSGSSR